MALSDIIFHEDEMATEHLMSPDIYFSPDVARLESERLWPEVWLLACQEQEVQKVGQYVVFDIDKESIVIIRSGADELKAYYNVCQHPGAAPA
jgi:phenylpropionate dioxygenase-like ring-hydroxylating dioxygenase large terminal subunit